MLNYNVPVIARGTKTLELVFEHITKDITEKPKRLFIVFNSSGGSVSEMWKQIALIAHYQQKGIRVETVVFDACHSACVNIYLMGTKRYAVKNARMIVHQSRLSGMGLMDKEVIKELKRISMQSIVHQCGRLKKDDTWCVNHYERTKSDWLLYPEDMLQEGFSHEIITDYRDLIDF